MPNIPGSTAPWVEQTPHNSCCKIMPRPVVLVEGRQQEEATQIPQMCLPTDPAGHSSTRRPSPPPTARSWYDRVRRARASSCSPSTSNVAPSTSASSSTLTVSAGCRTCGSTPSSTVWSTSACSPFRWSPEAAPTSVWVPTSCECRTLQWRSTSSRGRAPSWSTAQNPSPAPPSVPQPRPRAAEGEPHFQNETRW